MWGWNQNVDSSRLNVQRTGEELKTRRGFTQHRYRTQGRGGCTVVGISASWSCALGFSSHVGGWYRGGRGAFSIVVFLYYSSVCTLLGLIAFITVGEKLIQVFILTLCYVWFPFAKAKTDAILRLCNLLLFLSPRDVKGFLWSSSWQEIKVITTWKRLVILHTDPKHQTHSWPSSVILGRWTWLMSFLVNHHGNWC